MRHIPEGAIGYASLNGLRRSHIADMKHGAVVACVVDLFMIKAVSSELMVYVGTVNARVFHSDTKKTNTAASIVPITIFYATKSAMHEHCDACGGLPVYHYTLTFFRLLKVMWTQFTAR